MNRRDPSPQEAAFHGATSVQCPRDERELADFLRDAAVDGRRLIVAGSGAHAALTDPVGDSADLLSAAAFDGIGEYEPDDFTIGVGAGMPLAELRATLARNGQEIPLDTSAAAGGTVGGLIARAPGAPRTGRYGPLHAHVLGVEATTGDGRALRAGGMVVKNVAGYQLHKFLIGASGAGAVLRRVNFRLRPLPARRRLGVARFETTEEAWDWAFRLRSSGLEPAALNVVAGACVEDLAAAGLPDAGGGAMTAWVFEGNAATVAWQERETEALAGREAADVTIRAYDAEEAAALLDFVAGRAEPAGTPAETGIVRLAALPSALAGTAIALRATFRDRAGFRAGYVGDPTTGLLTLRWTGGGDEAGDPIKTLRQIARSRGGALRLLYLPPGARARFKHRLSADPNAALAERILRSLDPAGVLSRGRAAEVTA
jgi:glycolate oxidase FAD binding subunit